MHLKEAVLGDIVNFCYRQPLGGSVKRHLAKVVNVRKLERDEILRINGKSDYRVGDPEFVRTETLVTCLLPGGIARNFYAERAESCVKPVMGQAMFAIRDVLVRATRW